jgi:hypothetical protein
MPALSVDSAAAVLCCAIASVVVTVSTRVSRLERQVLGRLMMLGVRPDDITLVQPQSVNLVGAWQRAT